MADMEVRDARVKVGEYQKEGETKSRYMNVGVGFVSPHGNNIYLQLDTLPRDLAGWDGRIYLQSREKRTDSAGDVKDEPLDLNSIPF
jgi:hypothetical protein